MKKKIFYTTLATAVMVPAVIAPVYTQAAFTDVKEDSTYAEAVKELKQQGILSGYPDGTFRPLEPISRQHVLMLINKVSDLQIKREAAVFQDVPTTHPYYEVIQTAYQAGVVDGDAGYFYPQKNLTRAQAAKILTHAFALQKTGDTTFLDVSPDDWANDYIQALAAYELTTTAGSYFKPNEAVTRGQFALFLHRFLQKEEIVDISGEWTGELAIPQSALTIRLQLKEDGTGSISVPAQGVLNYPAEVTIIDEKLTVNVNLGGSQIDIEGTLRDGQIEAVFTQNGMTFPITFTPFKAPAVTYEEVPIPVTGGELKVALQWPEKQENVPVAIIIAGSGATTKDGNTIVGENNSLKMLAEDLAAQGIATIRYDKRGVGDNMTLIEREEDLSIALYAEDVEQIVTHVNADGRFSSVHVIGHSEGALVGMVAASEQSVDSIISIAGAGRPIGEVLTEQLAMQLPEDLLAKSTEILAQLKNGEQVEDVPEALYSLFRPSVQPYLMSWLQYDPATLLQQLETRALIIQGKNDLQVKVIDAEQLKEAVPASELVYFDTMNHVLKDAPADVAGNYATYANPNLPLVEGLVETIATFIQK